MAVTTKELQISNKSYINKDFASMYNEHFATLKNLSNRFDPSDSNESDPFILLLKLMDSVGDKINYNIDKNILERFILSCTQEQSMRELTSLLGYDMHYYKSAKTKVIFKYDFSKLKDSEGNTDTSTSSITIPQYSIVTDGEEIQYVTQSITSIQRSTGVSTEVEVIQGELKTLSVLDNTIVQLENLTDNNLLYFPEIMVAENGVFITDTSETDTWTKSTNLNTEVYGTRVYKFGFDSKKNLPYIEFPNWIADIIGEGLIIRYMITSGVKGNVMAKALTTLSRSGVSDNASDSDIIVTNYSSATSGEDVETIDEAYSGYHKTIGTFNTLTTCRDYTNAIFNLLDDNDNYVVSNDIVSDRRNDINYGTKVVCYGDQGLETKNIITKDASGNPVITAYDLCIYGTKPITSTLTTNVKKSGGYIDSYAPVSEDTISEIENYIEESKTISHDYKLLKNDDLFNIRDNYKLNATIYTNKKMNVLEQSEIIANICNTLIENYNPRQLSYGQALDITEMNDIMEAADSRIKSITLNEPEHDLKFVTIENKESPLYVTENGVTRCSDFYKFVTSKNILAGRISAFEYDDDFDYASNENILAKVEKIKAITTNCNLNAFKKGETTKYTLKSNESIQFIAPNLITKTTYPYGINYFLKLESGDYIPADAEYELKENDELVFTYKDGNSNTVITPLQAGDIIKPNMNFYTCSSRSSETPTLPNGVKNDTYPTEYVGYKFFTLTTNDTVDYCTVAKEELTASKKCYWLTNASQNMIKWKLVPGTTDSYYYYLNDNEHFFYSDLNLTSLYEFGTGTKLIITDVTKTQADLQAEWVQDNYINVESISEDGLAALKDVFITKVFSSTSSLTIYSNTIITIAEGDTLTLKNNSDADFSIKDNDFSAVISNSLEISYVYEGEETVNKLPDRSSFSETSPMRWACRATLDLNSSKKEGQFLDGNQTITYYKAAVDDNGDYIYDETTGYEADTEGVTIQPGNYFKLNNDLEASGGENIDLQYLTTALKFECPTLLLYEEDDTTTSLITYSDDFDQIILPRTIETDSGPKTYSEIDIYVNPVNDSDRYIMMYNAELDNEYTITAYTKDNKEIKCLTMFIPASTGLEGVSTLTIDPDTYTDTMTVIKISDKDLDTKCNRLHIEVEASTRAEAKISIMTSKIKLVKGINTYLGLTENDDIISYIKEKFPQQFDKFHILNDIDNSRRLEVSDAYNLSSSACFYDVNNIANKWIIPKIDFENSHIEVARSCRL